MAENPIPGAIPGAGGRLTPPPPAPPKRKPPGGGPVPPPPVPAKKEKALNKGNVWDRFVKANPEFAKAYGSQIWKWANTYKIDPTYLAALILAESGGDPSVVNSQRSAGLAQIHLPTWEGKEAWRGSGPVTEERAKNPAFAIRFAAWYFSRGVSDKGSYEAAYIEHYNPNDPNRHKAWAKIAGTVAKHGPGYVPRDSGLSPADAASVAVETSAEKQALTDPWVVIKNGKVSFKPGIDPPKDVARRAGGIPITASQWEQAKMAYGSIWYSLTGETNIPADRLMNWVKKGWSPTVVSNVVAKSHPKVVNSPLWKQQAPGMIGKAKEMFGNDWKVDQAFFRKAIAEGWDDATLVQKLRERPEYVNGPVFKNDEAAFTHSYTKVWGARPSIEDKITIREAVAQGWTQAQFEDWLRSNENYGSSAEAQDRMIGLFERLGMLTGEQTVLRPGEMPENPAFVPDRRESDVSDPAGAQRPQAVGGQKNKDATGTPGDDKRIKGKASPVAKKSNLTVGYR